ncbi:DnaA regulatory inactivator Hda [Pleionea sediminis]|uniref:DnaA regulatory inactivator Hda n=1 Tax=Pleionea sediminis TaxID=2569479 RepID=UPI0013DDC051|nr:DnaA regulatory inactivator Hda [Pleionea sediminis]
MQQLPLNIKLDQEVTLSSFLVGKNQILVEYLKQLSSELNCELVYLWGEPGSGKSHLLQAMANHQEPGSVIYLPLNELGVVPEMLQGLESFPIICIDDIQTIAGDRAWEEALFYLYNRVKDNHGNLVISASSVPAELGLNLKDLISRLSAMAVFKIQSLSDTDKQVLLQQKAAAKGLDLGSEVAQFVLSRSSRDLRFLMNALDKLDNASLVAQRKITVPFVKDVLGL